MKFPELIAGLKEFLRMSDLEPDDKGVVTIVFDEGLEVELLALTDNQLLVRAEVGRVPEDKDEHEAFYRTHLQRGLANLKEQTPALSLDSEAKVLWLYRTHRMDRLDVQQFCDLVEDFVNTVDWWKSLDSDAPQTPAAMMPFNMIRP